MIDLMLIGNRIRELRQERKWSKTELARRVGVSCVRIHQLEYNKRKSNNRGIALWVTVKIARAFDMTLSEFLQEEKS